MLLGAAVIGRVSLTTRGGVSLGLGKHFIGKSLCRCWILRFRRSIKVEFCTLVMQKRKLIQRGESGRQLVDLPLRGEPGV